MPDNQAGQVAGPGHGATATHADEGTGARAPADVSQQGTARAASSDYLAQAIGAQVLFTMGNGTIRPAMILEAIDFDRATIVVFCNPHTDAGQFGGAHMDFRNGFPLIERCPKGYNPNEWRWPQSLEGRRTQDRMNRGGGGQTMQRDPNSS